MVSSVPEYPSPLSRLLSWVDHSSRNNKRLPISHHSPLTSQDHTHSNSNSCCEKLEKCGLQFLERLATAVHIHNCWNNRFQSILQFPILKGALIQTGASIPQNSFDQYRRTLKVASNQVTSRMASTTLTTTPSLQPIGPSLQLTGPSLQQDGLPYHAPQEAGQVEQSATGDFPGLDL